VTSGTDFSTEDRPEFPLDIEMVEAGGLTFEIVGCGEGDRLALCLHGFPAHALCWRDLLPPLARLGYRAWAPNQRGYGNSSRPQGVAAYNIEKLIDDVAALIDASGAKETVLIGHDWGALVAWGFAARKVRPLKALIIMNVPHPMCYLRSLFRSAQLFKSWYILFFQLLWVPDRLFARNHAALIEKMVRRSSNPDKFPAAMLKIFRDSAAQPGAVTAMLNWYRALFRGGARRAVRSGFPVIHVPTLMIWGEADIALSKSATYDTHRYVSNLTLKYLPGVSHWVLQDAPDTVTAMIEEFLQSDTRIKT